MCVPGWEEAKTVAFPKGPEPYMGLLQPRTVIREEEKNDGKKACLAALPKPALAESPGTSVCL